jgi:peptidoglycan/xylan/chitin deacetylase (PgdA/CDA1 family)/GT2 family glycosyltransferase
MRLSVVIATRNRREMLRRCLAALAEQGEDPAGFDVVVAVDGSEDGTAEMLERLSTPYGLRVLPLERVGRPAARNAAIEAAAGEVCLVLDDDVIAAPELVGEHLAAHRAEPGLIGVGRIVHEVPSPGDWYSRMFAQTWNRHYAGLDRKPADWTACYGGNLSAPRAALLAIGGFAEDLPLDDGDDVELAFRLEEHGCRARFLPRADGVHVDQKSRRRLLADRGRRGLCCVALSERHPRATPKLLGWFNASTAREALARRVTIALRVPPAALAALGRLLPGEGRQQVWYDFVARHTFWLAVRRAMSRERWVAITHGVPVLMYHAFGERDEGDRFVVPRRAFRRQLRLLALLRFRVVAFEEIVEALRESRPPPARALAITIDDGYRDNAEIALPLLAERGLPATLFPVSGRFGGVNDWTADGALSGRPLLSADEARQLAADGVRIGAHTRSHRPLPEVPPGELADEVGGSREDLERLLGRPVPSFAYPHGEYDERTVEAVRKAGFRGACTVRPRHVQLGDDPLLVPRIEIRAGDSTLRFLRKLWLGGA